MRPGERELKKWRLGQCRGGQEQESVLVNRDLRAAELQVEGRGMFIQLLFVSPTLSASRRSNSY